MVRMVPTDTGVGVDSGEPISKQTSEKIKHNKVTWNTSKRHKRGAAERGWLRWGDIFSVFFMFYSRLRTEKRGLREKTRDSGWQNIQIQRHSQAVLFSRDWTTTSTSNYIRLGKLRKRYVFVCVLNCDSMHIAAPSIFQQCHWEYLENCLNSFLLMFSDTLAAAG